MGMGAVSWTSPLFLFVIPFVIPLFLNCILCILLLYTVQWSVWSWVVRKLSFTDQHRDGEGPSALRLNLAHHSPCQAAALKF